jgi:serine protease Do
VSEIAPGQNAALILLRDGKPETVNVKLATMPDEKQVADAGDSEPRQGAIGVALAPLSPELRQQLELSPDQRGVVVAGVQPNSPAAAAGLRQGDLLVGIGSKPVTAPADAVSAIRGATHDGKAVALRIMRDGQARFIAVTPHAQG